MKPRQSAVLQDARGFVHGFFGRNGGVSQGLFASLNCGYGSGDDIEAVRENRSRVAGDLGTSEARLLTAYQIHSAEAVTVTEPWVRGDAPRADAMVTATPGIALAVLTADCAPVLFADAAARVVGVAHAGWKGAQTGVLEAALRAMEQLGASRARIRAAVGPCISQASYEVGPEFRERFVDCGEDNAALFVPSRRTGHWQFDLPAYVLTRLRNAGLGMVDGPESCTYVEEGSYFSFRRSTHRAEDSYGRNISAIMLTP